MKGKLPCLALLFAAASSYLAHRAIANSSAAARFPRRSSRQTTITFHFRAPNAKEVAVQIEGSAKPVPNAKR